MNGPDMNDIMEQVKLQKQKAVDIGLMEAIEDLYDDLKYMPFRLQKDNSIWKPYVLEASCLQEEPKSNKINIKLYNDAEYTIVFNDNSNNQFLDEGDYEVTAGFELLIFAIEQKVFGLAFDRFWDKEYPLCIFYRATDVTAFREGTWIKDIQGLHNINRANKGNFLNNSEEERVNKLKEDFGI